ncbi:signal peptidase I [Euzebya tangerina]|uniref:signal peptidase I n=1 Tax=Euzebya tangerina TaxID=591198 RepID=UPI0013C35264|nr:signal peptidase I [Euzebya tangerina]
MPRSTFRPPRPEERAPAEQPSQTEQPEAPQPAEKGVVVRSSSELASESPAAAEAAEGSPSAATTVLRGLRELVQLLVIALVMAFIIKSLAMQAFFIPSGSMLQTLQIGDRVLVEKVTYRFRPPERGEVIVFRRPGLETQGFSLRETATSFLEGIGVVQPDPERDLIKRIIGLPGETIELIDGVVHINGRALEEPYAAFEQRPFGPLVVPAGEYFVMGDNRTNSLDSRFGLGTIPEQNIIGRTFAIIWPLPDATLAIDTDYPGVGEQSLGAAE